MECLVWVYIHCTEYMVWQFWQFTGVSILVHKVHLTPKAVTFWQCLAVIFGWLCMPTWTSSCITRSSSDVRVRIKSAAPSVVNVADTVAPRLSIMDMTLADNGDDNPSLLRRVSKFVVSELNVDTTDAGAAVSELCTDVTVVTPVSGTITIGVALMPESLFGNEAGCDASLSEPSLDSRVFEPTLWRFFLSRSCRFFFSSSPENIHYSTKDK